MRQILLLGRWMSRDYSRMFLRILQPLHTCRATVPSHTDESMQWSKIRKCVDSSAQRGPRKTKLKAVPLTTAPSQQQTVHESSSKEQEPSLEWLVVDHEQQEEDAWVIV